MVIKYRKCFHWTIKHKVLAGLEVLKVGGSNALAAHRDKKWAGLPIASAACMGLTGCFLQLL